MIFLLGIIKWWLFLCTCWFLCNAVVGSRNNWKNEDRKLNWNFIWCEKKRKKNFCLHSFLKWYVFYLTLTQQETYRCQDLPASSTSRCCWAPGAQLVAAWRLRPGPATLVAPSIPTSLCMYPGLTLRRSQPINPFLLYHNYLPDVLTICLICREDNILRSTYFPSESLCPKFNLLDTMDFFLKFLYKI